VAKKATGYAQRLLKLDPNSTTRNLTTGVSEYMLGSLPFFVRWFVHFDNVDGNKQKGIDRLEMVSREGRFLTAPFRKSCWASSRFVNNARAMRSRFLAELAHDFPANPLFAKTRQSQRKSSQPSLKHVAVGLLARALEGAASPSHAPARSHRAAQVRGGQALPPANARPAGVFLIEPRA